MKTEKERIKITFTKYDKSDWAVGVGVSVGVLAAMLIFSITPMGAGHAIGAVLALLFCAYKWAKCINSETTQP